MGYTPALRLKCLREEGFDPVDVSPLPRGEQFNMVSDIPYSSVDIGLPFFHDYGTNGGAPNSGMTRPGMVVGAQIIQVGNGAADTASLWRRWCLMRNSAARALLHIAIAAVRESRPGLSVIAATTCGVGKSVGGKWYGTTDATPFPTTPDTVAMDQAVAKIGSRSAGMLYATESMYVDPNWLKEANLESSSNYLTIPAANIQPATDSDPDAEKRYLSIALEAAGRWRGVVLDLREVPFETGTRLLRLITPVTSQNTAR